MMRASMSRPYESVPNKCSRPGGWRGACKFISTGSYGDRSGARIASATTASTTSAPTTAGRLPRAVRRIWTRQGVERKTAPGTAGISARTAAVLIAVDTLYAPYAWIDHGVQEVRRQIREDEDQRHEHRDPLNYRI